MKIRTDFVTNSSSCSFVSYSVGDSKMCRYLYDRLKKHRGSDEGGCFSWKGDRYHPKSYINLYPDGLGAEISLPESDMYYSDFEEEGYSIEHMHAGDWFDADIFQDHISYALKEESAQEECEKIIEEEWPENACNTNYDDLWDSDKFLYLNDEENKCELAKRLFELIMKSECEEYVKKDKVTIYMDFGDPKDYSETYGYRGDRAEITATKVTLISYCGPDEEEEKEIKARQESDNESAKGMLVSYLAEFIDFSELSEEGEDVEIILEELLEEDIAAGKVDAEVELGGTD